MATTPTSSAYALSKLFKLRMPVSEWDKLVRLSTANRRSVNSEILTAIEAYTTPRVPPLHRVPRQK